MAEFFAWLLFPGFFVIAGFFGVIYIWIWIAGKVQSRKMRLYVTCPKCETNSSPGMSGRKSRDVSLVRKKDNGYRDGWHYETQSADTHTVHRDEHYHIEGWSDSTTEYDVRVPDRTFYWTEFYKCPDCATEWTAEWWNTVNI